MNLVSILHRRGPWRSNDQAQTETIARLRAALRPFAEIGRRGLLDESIPVLTRAGFSGVHRSDLHTEDFARACAAYEDSTP